MEKIKEFISGIKNTNAMGLGIWLEGLTVFIFFVIVLVTAL